MQTCAKGGNIVLKMYSLITYHSVYILEMAANCFEKAYITKPYTSKILNMECYLVGLSRNNKPFTPKQPLHKIFESPNFETIEKYEKSRDEERMWMGRLFVKGNKFDHEYQEFLRKRKNLMRSIKELEYV
jgi:hypothetical protein